MLFVSTAEDPANPVGELVSTQHSLGLNYLAFAMRIHCGSIALSHGLLVGNRHATIRSPWPLALTSRLWALIHSLTSWLLCQLALSQIRSRSMSRRLWVWFLYCFESVHREVTPEHPLLAAPQGYLRS